MHSLKEIRLKCNKQFIIDFDNNACEGGKNGQCLVYWAV